MTTEPSNQWPVDLFNGAVQSTVIFETERRLVLQEHCPELPRLSTRQDAIERDVMRNWLSFAYPAGTA